MFTDTKNLANLNVNITNAAAKQSNTHIQDDDKSKLKRMWKPILRLMSRKSALAKNEKRDNNSTILNNVNLNNAYQYSNTNKDSITALEDSSYMAHKLPLAEFLQSQQQQYQTAQQQTETKPLEFIRKASIDKTPLDTCTSCVYGRNCQHTQFHQIPTMDLDGTTQFHSHPQTRQHQNFNYFDAEDGCFVWSDNSGDVDENALREWFWQNSWQFAENATMC